MYFKSLKLQLWILVTLYLYRNVNFDFMFWPSALMLAGRNRHMDCVNVLLTANASILDRSAHGS